MNDIEGIKDQIEKLKKENEKLQESIGTVKREHTSCLEDFEDERRRISKIASSAEYLSNEELLFFEEYSEVLKKEQNNLEDAYDDFCNEARRKIEINQTDIEIYNYEINNEEKKEEVNENVRDKD